MAEEKKESAHEQPFPNARPSLYPAENFDANVAKEAAKKLRQAMKGLGTNEKKIIEVTNAYGPVQRLRVKQAFASEFNRDLIKDLKSELSGNFEKLCIPFYYERGQYDAKMVKDAVDGMGFNTELLNEIICTRTNEQLGLMQQAWDSKRSMQERIKDETSKAMGNNNYSSLLLTILECKRPANDAVDKAAALADAETLNRVINQEKSSDAKAKFVEIFTQRSWVTLREISGIFQDVAKKYTLNGAIKKAFGDGDTGKALMTIDEFVTQPYDYFAKKLRESMKGMGTDDDLLRRIIVSRADVDMRDIAIVFGQRYGDGKTLQKWLKDDLRGDYEKLALALCGLE